MIQTSDGSYTLYNKVFDQHYHSVKEGALNESLHKHVIPALEFHKNKKELNILDICFGLGYNVLSTLYYISKNNLNIKVNIYSPEFDTNLLKSLSEFIYPIELEEFKPIINKLSSNLEYKSDNISIQIYNGDAREYIKKLVNSSEKSKSFDIVYQDAFSSDVNKLLWTKEYFSDIKSLLSPSGIITTYSIATPIRLSMYVNNLHIYQYKSSFTNKITIALNKKLNQDIKEYKYIDMELKQKRNPTAQLLRD